MLNFNNGKDKEISKTYSIAFKPTSSRTNAKQVRETDAGRPEGAAGEAGRTHHWSPMSQAAPATGGGTSHLEEDTP